MSFMPPLKVDWPDLDKQPRDAGPHYGCILGCLHLFVGAVVLFLATGSILYDSEDMRAWLAAAFGLGLFALGSYRAYVYIRSFRGR